MILTCLFACVGEAPAVASCVPGAFDAPWWFEDEDGDGSGSAIGVQACEAPPGSVAGSEDCDDTRADVHENAEERCGGGDEDCDGRVDVGAVDAGTWYPDGDSDTFGNAGYPVVACEAPAGFVSDATDCYDGDAEVYPGAVEWCDGVDQDCDGTVDDDSLDASNYYADGDGDGWADQGSSVADCAPPVGYLEAGAIGDCDDADAQIHPAAVEACDDGVDMNCDGFERPCPLAASLEVGDGLGDVWAGEANACRAGQTVAWADTDADGLDEAIVGVYQDSTEATWAGSVYVVTAWGGGARSLADATARYTGTTAYDTLGASLAAAGDVDGDGFGDLLLGAPGSSAGASAGGAVYLMPGPVRSTGPGGALATVLGTTQDDVAGKSVAGLGDLDNDGFADFAVGAPGFERGSGAAFVYFGPVAGELGLEEADASLLADPYEYVGQVASGGDVDGDGRGDLLAGGAVSDGEAGVVYVVTEVPTGESTLASAEARIAGANAGDRLGPASSIVGDVDADGYADIVLGAPYESVTSGEAGAAWLVLGPVRGDVDLAHAEATLLGDVEGDFAGISVATAGDVDGDGRADFLVGASGQDEAGSLGGAVYVLLGPIAGTSPLGAVAYAKLLPHTPGTDSGTSVAGGGDLDGDGHPEVLWGAPDYDWLGALFIVPGTAL